MQPPYPGQPQAYAPAGSWPGSAGTGVPATTPGEPGGWKIGAGYVFAVLGGLIGIAIGGHLWRTQTKLPDGRRVPRYDAATRRQGLIILAISSLMGAFWIAMQAGQ